MSIDFEERALLYFKNGYNCCESTLLVGCDILGIKDFTVPRIATCFGGGINGSGGVCGLYTGAMMAIGLKHGRDSHEESRDPAQSKGREFQEFWLENMKKVDCRELIDRENKAHEVEHFCRPTCAKVAGWLRDNL